MAGFNPFSNNFESGGFFYNAIRQDIAIVRGDTCSFGFQIQGLEGQVPESVSLIARANINDEEALFNLGLGTGIDRTAYDAETDIATYKVRITPEQTDIEPGRYFYELSFKLNSDAITLMKGRMAIDSTIRGEIAPPSPSIPDGDDIYYPMLGIPEGQKKAYTEQYVSNIATAIMQMTGSDTPMTIAEMSEAITQIVRGLNVRKININRTTYEEAEI